MGFFSGLEGNLEKYIEGLFKNRYRGRVQPAEIAKKLAREMRDRNRVSVNLVYVPNEYSVLLHPGDWSLLSGIADALSRELAEHLGQVAIDKGYTVVGQIKVGFLKDDAVPSGQAVIRSRYGQAPAGRNRKEDEKENSLFEDTLMYNRDRDTAPVQVIRNQTNLYLVVLEGALQGRSFRLEGRQTVVGRRELCDVIIADSSISRRHARIDMQGGGLMLTDLDSTNGTYVNGVRIQTKKLEPGDMIKFGQTLCSIKVE